MQALLDQPFGHPSGVPLSFDFFRPDNGETLPLVICIHGGGWISGDKEDMRDVAVELVNKGYATACPNYRLAPLHPYPAAIQDMQEFARYCRANSASLNIDGRRIASLGNSAGGYLSAMIGLTDQGGSRVNLAIPICAITDLSKPREQHLPISWSFLEEYMGVPYEGNEETYRQASPMTHVSAEAPPFLILHGEADDVVPVEQSRTLTEELEKAGVHVRLHTLPNELHSFTYDGWAKIEGLYTEFLNEHFSHALR